MRDGLWPAWRNGQSSGTTGAQETQTRRVPGLAGRGLLELGGVQGRRRKSGL